MVETDPLSVVQLTDFTFITFVNVSLKMVPKGKNFCMVGQVEMHLRMQDLRGIVCFVRTTKNRQSRRAYFLTQKGIMYSSKKLTSST